MSKLSSDMKLNTLVLFLGVLLSSFSIITGCYEDERSALLDFKSHLTDPSDRLISWRGLNYCDWYGVGCSYSLHVISVNLRNPDPDHFMITSNSEQVLMTNPKSKALIGTISPAFFTLQYLIHLDLSHNNFMFSKIPSEFANLRSLSYLNLSNAMFNDSVTIQLANLTSLRSLDISCVSAVHNYSHINFGVSSSMKIYDTASPYTYIFSGYVSTPNLHWLYGLQNLRELNMAGVDLSKASISTKWADPISYLRYLRVLLLSNCRIQGKIPVDPFLNLTHLFSLTMDFNTFTSPIPIQLQNLSSLSFLDLSSTSLQGSIPYLPQLKELYVGNNPDLNIDLNSLFAENWPSLEIIHIYSTKVVSALPYSLGNTTSLIDFFADNCSIQGSLPSSLTNLTKLEVLSLNINNITGHLPSSFSNWKSIKTFYFLSNSLSGHIPDSVCDMQSVQHLALSFNKLTGALPHCINRLPNLRFLLCNYNNMNGTVSLGSLAQNTLIEMLYLGFSGLIVQIDYPNTFPSKFQPCHLDLSSSNLHGTFPEFISNLSELTFLRLENNSLTGPIPQWLFNLPKLGYLGLSSNKFWGLIPSNIRLHTYFGPRNLKLADNNLEGSIPRMLYNVEALDLSRNNFTGIISPEIGLEVAMRYLSLSGNKLSGTIPESLCQANSALNLLDLSDNKLSGTVPNSLSNCRSLVFLGLGGNNLSGFLPNELEAAAGLKYIGINHNSFKGPFPVFLQKLQNLMFLNAEENKFEGELPQFLGELRELRILVLRSNSFNGSIPQEINMLEKLQYIDLSNNQLSGPIPSTLNGLKVLMSRSTDANLLGFMFSRMFTGVAFRISTKGYSYQIPAARSYDSGISLSHNMLTGKIPSDLGLLAGLAMLNISHNFLSGKIPNNIGGMQMLESLDISFNKLSGEIPASLASIDSLSVLNLSHNNLSGNLPAGQHFQTLDISGFTGNKYLCGAPDGVDCSTRDTSPNPETHVSDYSKQNILFYGVVAMGYFVGFWLYLGTIYLMKENWKKKYWGFIDKIVLKAMHCLNGND